MKPIIIIIMIICLLFISGCVDYNVYKGSDYDRGYEQCRKDTHKPICMKFKDISLIRPKAVQNYEGILTCYNNCSDIWLDDLNFHLMCERYYR